jgi:hypothetical protein
MSSSGSTLTTVPRPKCMPHTEAGREACPGRPILVFVGVVDRPLLARAAGMVAAPDRFCRSGRDELVGATAEGTSSISSAGISSRNRDLWVDRYSPNTRRRDCRSPVDRAGRRHTGNDDPAALTAPRPCRARQRDGRATPGWSTDLPRGCDAALERLKGIAPAFLVRSVPLLAMRRLEGRHSV